MTAPASYHCTNADCGGLWAEDQVVHQQFGGKEVRLCPRCRLGVEELVAEPKFWERVPDAFRYPLERDGPWILLSGTVFFLFLKLGQQVGFFLVSIVALVIFIGYFGMLFMQIIQTASADEQRRLEWPDITGLGDLVVVFFQILGSLAVVFAPAIFCAVQSANQVVAGAGGGALLGWTALTFAAGLLGLVYYPMAFLGLSMFDSINGVNPLVVLPAIWKTRWQYLLVLALLVGLYLLRLAVAGIAALLPWWGQWVIALPVNAVVLYTMLVSARLLGLLYRSNRQRIAWFG